MHRIGPSYDAVAEFKDGKLTVWTHSLFFPQGLFPLQRDIGPRR